MPAAFSGLPPIDYGAVVDAPPRHRRGSMGAVIETIFTNCGAALDVSFIDATTERGNLRIFVSMDEVNFPDWLSDTLMLNQTREAVEYAVPAGVPTFVHFYSDKVPLNDDLKAMFSEGVLRSDGEDKSSADRLYGRYRQVARSMGQAAAEDFEEMVRSTGILGPKPEPEP